MGDTVIGEVKHPLTEDEKRRNDELWIKMMGKTSRVAKRISATDWEDLASEAYILFRGRNRWDEPYDGLMKKYLLEAARNLGLWVKTDALEPGYCPDGGDGIEDAVDYKFLAAAVDLALGKLSPLCQAIIRMRYFADLPCRAVAESLGIPMAEAYHVEYSARVILSRLLRDFAPNQEPMDFGPLFGGENE
jgi:DNA-directed RNA polymerase specialized sigma24 family protein